MSHCDAEKSAEAETVERVGHLVNAAGATLKEKRRPIKVVARDGTVKKVIPHVEVIEGLLHHEGIVGAEVDSLPPPTCRVCGAIGAQYKPIAICGTCRKAKADERRQGRTTCQCGGVKAAGAKRCMECSRRARFQVRVCADCGNGPVTAPRCKPCGTAKRWRDMTEEERAHRSQLAKAQAMRELPGVRAERARIGGTASAARRSEEERADMVARLQASQTREQRSENGRKSLAKRTAVQRSEAMRKAWEKRRAKAAAEKAGEQ